MSDFLTIDDVSRNMQRAARDQFMSVSDVESSLQEDQERQWLDEYAAGTVLYGFKPDKVKDIFAKRFGSVRRFDEKRYAGTYDKKIQTWKLAEQIINAGENAPIYATVVVQQVGADRVPDIARAVETIAQKKGLHGGFFNRIGKALERGVVNTQTNTAAFFGYDKADPEQRLAAGELTAAKERGAPLVREGAGFLEKSVIGAAEQAFPMWAGIATGAAAGTLAGPAAAALGAGAGTAASVAGLTERGAQAAYWYTQIQPERYAQYRREGLNPEVAERASRLSGAVEAAVETLIVNPFKGAKGSLPTSTRQWIARQAIRAVKSFGGEWTEEALQATSAELFGELGERLDQDAPKQGLDERARKVARQTLESFGPLLVMQAVGSGGRIAAKLPGAQQVVQEGRQAAIDIQPELEASQERQRVHETWQAEQTPQGPLQPLQKVAPSESGRADRYDQAPEFQPPADRQVIDEVEGRKLYEEDVSAQIEKATKALYDYRKRKGYGPKTDPAFLKLDAQYQQLKKDVSDARKLLTNQERTETKKKNEVERQRAKNDALTRQPVRPAMVKYAPLDQLPDEIRIPIQTEAKLLLAETKSERTKAVLQKIVDDAGKDKGAAVEQQKERIAGILTGEVDQRTTRQKEIGVPERPPDPIVELFMEKDFGKRAATIEQAKASVQSGEQNDLVDRARDWLERSQEHPFGVEPEEVVDFLDSLQHKVGLPEGEAQSIPPSERQVIGGEGGRRPYQEQMTKEVQPVQETEAKPRVSRANVLFSAGGSERIPVAMEPGGEAISFQQIATTAEHDFGIPIRWGRFRQKARGIYKQGPEVVRLGRDSNLGTLIHEVAHHIDKTLGPLKGLSSAEQRELVQLSAEHPKPSTAEGFAEFVRRLLTREDAAELAPRFAERFDKWIQGQPETAAKLDRLRRLIDQYRQPGAAARAGAQISKTGKPERPAGESRTSYIKDVLSKTWHAVYGAMSDKGHFLEQYQQEAKQRGYNVPIGDDPYTLFRAFSKAGPTLAAKALEDGPIAISKKNFGKKLGPSLAEALSYVTIKEYRNKDFQVYAYALHTLESIKAGKETGLSQEDAQWIVLNHGTAEQRARWAKGAQLLTQFNNAGVLLLADSGVDTEEKCRRVIESYGGTYIPLHRVGDWVNQFGKSIGGGMLVDISSPIMRRRGSKRQIVDPVQASIANMMRFYQRAWQQELVNAMWEMGQTEGMGKWWEEVPPEMTKNIFALRDVKKQLEKLGIDPEAMADLDPAEQLFVWRPDFNTRGGDPIVRVTHEGAPKMIYINKGMWRSVKGMNRLQIPWLLDITLGKMARVQKLGITGLSTAFGGRNIQKDFQTYLMQQGELTGPEVFTKPIEMLGRYIASSAAEVAGKQPDARIKLWKDFGGPLGQYFGLDRKAIRSKAQNMMRSPARRKQLAIVSHPIDAARDAISVSDVGPRLAVFDAVLRRHGWTEEKIRKEGLPPRHVIAEGLLKSGNSTVDFKRSGWVGQFINQITPFFNPAIQGIDIFVQTWRNAPGRTFMRSAVLASVSLAYWWHHKDEDWYREAKPWLKFGFWTLSDEEGRPFARIPRSFEWGWEIASGVEAVADAIYRKDPDIWIDYAKQNIHQLLPPLKPALIGSLVETYFNWDFFRERPIESEKLQRLEPGYRSTPYNTSLVKNVCESLQRLKDRGYPVPAISPSRTEYLIDQLSGGLYRRTAKLAEGIATGGKSMQPADIPFVSAVALRQEYTSTQDEFYKAYHDVSQEYASARLKGNVPQALARRKTRLADTADLVKKVRDLVPDTQDRDARFAVERYVVGLTRWAMEKEPLARYPNPLAGDGKGAPSNIRSLAKGYTDKLRRRRDAKIPTKRIHHRNGTVESVEDFKARKESVRQGREAAKKILKELGDQ